MNPRRRAHLLAAIADFNLLTAQRVLNEGPDACRAYNTKDHARRILKLLPKIEKEVVRLLAAS